MKCQNKIFTYISRLANLRYNLEVKLEFNYENKIPVDYSRENYLSQVYDKNLIDKVIYTDSLTFLEYSVKGKISKIACLNSTNSCYNLNDEQISYHHWGINIGLNYLNFWPDDYFGNNELVKIIFPYELIQLRDLLKNESNNINVDPEFMKIIESIKINDNPVLFVYSQ